MCTCVCISVCVCLCATETWPLHFDLDIDIELFCQFFLDSFNFFLLNRSFDWLFGWWSVSSGGEFSHFFSSHSWTKKKVFSVFVWLHNKKKKIVDMVDQKEKRTDGLISCCEIIYVRRWKMMITLVCVCVWTKMTNTPNSKEKKCSIYLIHWMSLKGCGKEKKFFIRRTHSQIIVNNNNNNNKCNNQLYIHTFVRKSYVMLIDFWHFFLSFFWNVFFI